MLNVADLNIFKSTVFKKSSKKNPCKQNMEFGGNLIRDIIIGRRIPMNRKIKIKSPPPFRK